MFWQFEAEEAALREVYGGNFEKTASFPGPQWTDTNIHLHGPTYVPSSSACSETPGQSSRSRWGCPSGKPQRGGSVQELLAERNRKKNEPLFSSPSQHKNPPRSHLTISVEREIPLTQNKHRRHQNSSTPHTREVRYGFFFYWGESKQSTPSVCVAHKTI